MGIKRENARDRNQWSPCTTCDGLNLKDTSILDFQSNKIVVVEILWLTTAENWPSSIPFGRNEILSSPNYTLFLCKNKFYKNIEAQNRQSTMVI